MRRDPSHRLLVVLFLVLIAGCGGKPEGTQPAGSAATAALSATVGTAALAAGLDDGPRAGAENIAEDKVAAGERLFQSKGCSASHGFGKRVSCPDLQGVSLRRTAKWMESQILHPDLMVKQDPTAHELFAQFALQMPKQGLTPDEAKSVIEYFKHMDHEAGEAHEAGKEKH